MSPLYMTFTSSTSPHHTPIHTHTHSKMSCFPTIVGLCSSRLLDSMTQDSPSWSYLCCLPASYLAWVCSQLNAFQNQRLCDRCFLYILQHIDVMLLLSPFSPLPTPCSCCRGGMSCFSHTMCSYSFTQSPLYNLWTWIDVLTLFCCCHDKSPVAAFSGHCP